MNPEQHRKILEQSGEALKNDRTDELGKRSQYGQNEQVTEWDSLKDVPFRGSQQEESEEDEMEMEM